MMAESIWAGVNSEIWSREFRILRPATLKLRAPSEVRTNRTESRLALGSLRERVE